MAELSDWIAAPESEGVERKEAWSDECLKALAALANTRGGILLVGVADDGRVVGWKGDGKEQERIVSQIVSMLRAHPASIQPQSHTGQTVLVIEMARAAAPVALRGRYYRRVGNSTRDVPEESLQRFLLDRTGQSWEALPSDAGLDELDEKTIANFVALAKPRLPALAEAEDTERILQNLNLLAANGRLRNAAVLLFGGQNAVSRLNLSAEIHMGRFKDYTTILDNKLFRGNLFQQLDAAMYQFRQYLQARFEFHKQMGDLTGLQAAQRIEIWDFPLDALREAVANALMHREYAVQSSVTIRVFDDRVEIGSPGGLPEGISLPELYQENHRSVRRNPLLADAFYFASVIERWGSGTTRMAQLCRAQRVPEPEFAATPYDFTVTFSKDPYTPERLRQMGLSDRQAQAIQYVREHSSVSNAEYRELTAVSARTAATELTDLVAREIFTPSGGRGRAARYRLRIAQIAQ